MSEFNPGRMDWARQYRGWTRKGLAERCGVSAPYMTRLLNGDGSNITEPLIQRVAFETGFPVTFFILPTGRVDGRELTFRRKARMGRAVSDAIAAEWGILTDVLDRVRALGEVRADIGWLDDLAPDGNVSAADVRRIAGETRECWGEPESGPIRNVMRGLERHGIPIIPLTVKPGEGMSDGVTRPSPAGGSPFVGYFPDGGTGDRLRFTMAHELGHLILHRRRAPADRRMMEREAHMFAGELLMPMKDVRAVVDRNTTLEDFARIKAGWGVSVAAIIRRARDCGVIDDGRYKSLYVQLSRRHWLKREPVDVGVEHPILFKQLVGRAFNGLDDYVNPSVTRGGVEGFLGVPFELLDAWCDRHLTLKPDGLPELE